MNGYKAHMAHATSLYTPNADMANVENALTFVSPEICRNEWVRIAMAIKSELGEAGYSIFDNWSQGSDKYIACDCRDTWRSIKCDGGVTIATLFGKAKEHGKKNQIEGEYKEGDRVILIEDLVNQGSSLKAAVEALKSEGLNPMACFCIVNSEMKDFVSIMFLF